MEASNIWLPPGVPNSFDDYMNDSHIDFNTSTTNDCNAENLIIITSKSAVSTTKSVTSSTNSKIHLLLWNACNLNIQINSFQSFVYCNNFDIVAITETWLID